MKMNYSTSIYNDSWRSGQKKNLPAEWTVCTSLWEALGWNILWSVAFYRCTDLVGSVLVLVAIGRGSPWPASMSLRGLSPHAITLLGGAMFIALHMGRPFLEECQRVPRHFWSRRDCLGSGPAPGLTKKGFVPPSSSSWGVRQIPIISKQGGVYALHSGTHFGWLRLIGGWM